MHINGTTDASLSDGTGVLLIGDQDGENLILDGNEIVARDDGAGSILYLGSGGTETRIHKTVLVGDTTLSGGSDNDGTTAALKIVSGSQTMLVDGNEIDSNGTLYLNSNSKSDVSVGGILETSELIQNTGETVSLLDGAIRLSADLSNSNNRSQRLFFKEQSSTDDFGFSLIYNGSVDDTFLDGTSFTTSEGNLTTNTLHILRHDGAGINGKSMSISRSSGVVTFHAGIIDATRL